MVFVGAGISELATAFLAIPDHAIIHVVIMFAVVVTVAVTTATAVITHAVTAIGVPGRVSGIVVIPVVYGWIIPIEPVVIMPR